MSTSRQNIQAAFSREGTSQVAAVIPYEGIYIRDHWRALTAAPWWHAHSPDLAQQLAWRSDVLARSGYDWFELTAFYSRAARGALSIEQRDGSIYRIDRRTGEARRLAEPQISGWSPGGDVQSIRPDQPAQTVDEIDALIPLAPAFDATPGRDELARALIAQHPDHYPLGYAAAPLWRTYHLWGFEGMMEMIATRPDLVRHACERYVAEAVNAIREAAWLGAAGVWIEDCLTDMIGPQAFVEMNVPHLRRPVDEIHAAGMAAIHYFCGNPAGKWDALLSTGADALALEESKKGFRIDIAEVVERVAGRCAVLGNLDAIGILQDGDETQLRAEIKRQIAAGRGNRGKAACRFILSIGSPVTPGTPVERVRLYCDLAHELGRVA